MGRWERLKKAIWRHTVRRIVPLKAEPKRELPPSINPRANQPPLDTPGGFTAEQLLPSLMQVSIDGSTIGELQGYAREDHERFMRTVGLIPAEARTVLEIGANPYFTTLLMRWFRPELALTLTNWFGRNEEGARQTVSTTRPDGTAFSETLAFHTVNVETMALPFADESFDCVLYCEVIEHMTNDPLASLHEVWRVLKPDGWLVLTTPNAARIENVTRLVAGLGVQDQYSGYGPYGRHNREYTRQELEALVGHAGFALEHIYTADVHANHAAIHVRDPAAFATLVEQRRHDLGQYIFSRWRKGAAGDARRPGWLYRSLPGDALVDVGDPVDPPKARW